MIDIQKRNEAIKQAYAKKHEEWVNNLLSSCSKEDLQKYYFEHSKADTCKHFNLSNSSISFLLKYYNIKKSYKDIVNLRKQTTLEKYGVENVMQAPEIQQKSKLTCLEKYGVEYSFQSDNNKVKSKQTCVERYGFESATQSQEVKDKIKQTKFEKYGNSGFVNPEKSKQTRIEKCGSLYESYKLGLEKQSKVIQERYGVAYACMRPEARNFSKTKSKLNNDFASKLISLGYHQSDVHIDDISYFSREFAIGKKQYDFKIGNTLIELNPYPTHNSTWGLYNNPLDKNYHIEKSKLAINNGYRCICVWDWDDVDKIIKLLPNKSPCIYARNCSLRVVNIDEEKEFLNKNHLQNYVKSDVAIGLYYNNQLVSIMTFGKPRYNKNYEWELLRYCSIYKIVGGAKKLFNYFLRNYNPLSIISYCDKSKFIGNLYHDLGFTAKEDYAPSKHWYNDKLNRHITDNLLRQRGYDQLFGTNYGKGSSNEQLMLENNFVEIYDCGQQTFIYKGVL